MANGECAEYRFGPAWGILGRVTPNDEHPRAPTVGGGRALTVRCYMPGTGPRRTMQRFPERCILHAVVFSICIQGVVYLFVMPISWPILHIPDIERCMARRDTGREYQLERSVRLSVFKAHPIPV